ncbi:unnamed protein product [Blepharisma stoltei]|uniref:Synergin gamma C-terminal domain-containing protein n=1 Tax=Blepharisma stoltei TaxID=1481888 RepID=A0AAU9JWF8_9CILI|nr:unnamed protein product [Blepharisma stoltei]
MSIIDKMEDEFTEFKSSTTVFDVDLLEFRENSPGIKPQKRFPFSEQLDAPAPVPAQSNDENFPQPPSIKKKQFIFPSDFNLDIAPISGESILDLHLPIQPVEVEKLNPWTLLDDSEGLKKLSVSLLSQGRLDEALKCRKHSETLKEIERIKEIKSMAAEREDYDTAIQYRNILIQLEKELSSPDEIENWIKDKKELTLKELEEKVTVSYGSEAGREFAEKFVYPEVKTSLDIENIKEIFLKAQFYCEIKKILSNQSAAFLSQSQLVLQKISEELKRAVIILNKLKPSITTLDKDEDLKTYLKGLSEVYQIYERLHFAVEIVGTLKSLEFYSKDIPLSWSECGNLFNYDIPKLRLSKLSDKFCTVCLFPISQSVMLSGSNYHSACANFWVNRISTDPPRFRTFL